MARPSSSPTDAITRAILTGFLKHAGGEEVNSVNVRTMAATLGLLVEETKSSEQTDFTASHPQVAGRRHQPVQVNRKIFQLPFGLGNQPGGTAGDQE